MKKTNVLKLIDRALRLYEEARSARDAVSVSEIAGRFSKGRGKGAGYGRRYHSKIWSLDPYAAAYEPVWACPLPLAWRFRWGWLYGVADQVVFENGVPIAVIEYKSYPETGKAEEVQVALYGLLVELVFCVGPRAYLITPNGTKEVKEWKELAISSLSPLRRTR